MTPDKKARKGLPAEEAELFNRLLEDPNVKELAELYLARGYDAGRARGVAEERLDHARRRKGKKGVPRRPGRPSKIHVLMLELIQGAIDERPSGVTQVAAIEEFQRDHKEKLRDEGLTDRQFAPFLEMDPESILATMRQRLRQKE